MASFNFDPPSSVQENYDHLLFDSPFTVQNPEWIVDEPLFDNNEVAFDTIPDAEHAQADLYQTLQPLPSFFSPSYAGFAGPSNAGPAGPEHILSPRAVDPTLESGTQQHESQDAGDGQGVPGEPTAGRQSETRRNRPRNIDWEPHKDTLKKLYIDQDKTLDEVMVIMKDDIDATPRQYKERFRFWQWQKKLPGDVAVWMSVKRQKRKREDGKETTFSWRGIEWKIPKIESSAARASKQIPAVQNGIRMTTPVGVDYWTPRMANRSPLGVAVPVNASPRAQFVASPFQHGAGATVGGTAQTHPQPRHLLLTWDGRPKSELENVYQTARASHRRREHQLAEGLYSQALEGYKSVVGPTEEETLRVLHAFASFHVERGNDAKAYGLLEDSVQAHVMQFGEDSDQTLHYSLDVANLLSGCNREDDAIAFLRSAQTLLALAKAKDRDEERPSNGKVSLPSIGELLAAAEAASQSSDPSSLEFGMKVARTATKAGEPAAEALLLAIISHCEYDPGKLASQRLRAWGDIIDLYRTRDEASRNPDNHRTTIDKAEGAFNATVKLRPWRQADAKDFRVLKACLKLAKSVLEVNEHARAERMFDQISRMTERLFGLGEQSIAVLIEIGQIYQEKNGWSSSRPWFEHALANAIQELPEQDGVRKTLEAAQENRHFAFCNDDGEPYKTVLGVNGLVIRPNRMYLDC